MSENGRARKRKPDEYICSVCSKRIKRKNNYDRHVKSHESSYPCQLCNQTFSRFDSLQRHQRGHFLGYKSKEPKKTCQYCGYQFDNYQTLFSHVQSVHPTQQTGGNDVENHRFEDKNALDNTVKQHYLFPNEDDKYDLLVFFIRTRREIEDHLKQRCAILRHIKWYLNIQVSLIRENSAGEIEEANPHFHSGTFTLLSQTDDINHHLNEAFQKMFKSFDEFVRKGSGWTLKKIISLEIHTAKYKPLGGSSYMEIPRSIRYTKGVVNVKNEDNRCFLWSVLASLHPADVHGERVQHYEVYEGELDMTGIPFPVKLSSISRFEKQNNISVNVFGFEEEQIFPLYISTIKDARHEVDLLYLQKENNSHYCWIKNLNRFLARTKTRKHNHHFCRYCLQGFQQKHTLDKHLRYCSRYDMQCTTLPESGKDDLLQFRDYHKQLRVPFVIYADFETYAKKLDTCEPDPVQSSTTSTVKFEPCGYGYQVVCVDDRHTKPPVVYRGDNVSSHFIQSIMEEEQYIKDILQEIEPMKMTLAEEQAFKNSTNCHICGKTIGKHKVRDHCHVSGKYRGAACQDCNLNFRHVRFIPVIFHNLKNFDAHIICEALGQFKCEDITCIPNNMEKYVSFSLGDLRFLDSYQFVNCSLAEMTNNLAEEGLTPFKRLTAEFTDTEEARLLLRKGVYPYEYVDCSDKFEENQLPTKEAFYSHLSKSHISDQDYIHAHMVWDTMKISSMGEYHDLYLKIDVLLLADCFERFRDTCLQHYNLDPCHFYTCPGLAWSAALKMTQCKLDLLTDPDMYMFFENGIRGGISVISHKYAKANNKFIPGYDSSLPTSYISYLDANNLYGWSMCQPLPEKNFRWLCESEIKSFDVMQVSKNSEKGYVLEVDLEYHKELHTKHNCYPLAPETLAVSNQMLSSCSRKIWEEQNPKESLEKRVITPKLIPSLRDKHNYILHYRNLKLYLKLGLKLCKIHRILEFDQSQWLKCYIDFNTEQRKLSTTESGKAFFKLMNNSVFGKTMENVRKRVDIRLVHTKQKLLKQTAKSSFKRFSIFNEDLIGVEHRKVNLILNKPVYVGQAVLDLSKTLMYRFHYYYIKEKYGDDAILLFTDTDSLCYYIQTESIYKDMQDDAELFDLSNFPTDHFAYDATNKKLPGYFKDETAGIPIQEFVGLRSKMYSYTFDSNQKQTAKGISRATVQRDLRHEHYKMCLFQRGVKMGNMDIIYSQDHELGVQRINKVALSAFDDKRYLTNDGITTLAHFHFLAK